MNPSTLGEAIEVVDNIVNFRPKSKVILLVPYPFIPSVCQKINNSSLIEVSSQDCYTELSGAYTGAILISMIKSFNRNWIKCNS